MSASIIEYAQSFALGGFGIIPLWSCDPGGECRCPPDRRTDEHAPGKHPMELVVPHGVKNATQDAETISRWLALPSQPNYGMTPPAGVVALDVDGPLLATFAELEDRLGPLPATMRTITANGEHVMVRLVDDPGGDLFGFVTRRWLKGYVVGPGSVHPSGHVYAWNGIRELAPLPAAWLAEARGGRLAHIGSGRDPKQVRKGQRHDNLRDTARHYAGTVRDPEALRAAVLAWNAKLPEPKSEAAVDTAIGEALAKFPEDPPKVDPGPQGLKPASCIVPHRVDWLWWLYIAIGKVTMLDGRPGLGKSCMTLDIAARITRGLPMPDGTPGIGPAPVIVITAEDDWEDTVVPRLMAAGADLELVYPVYDLTLPDGAEDLGALVAEVGAVLVIIDPLVAFVPGTVNLYRDQDARRALKPLAAVMARTGCAALALRHVSKASGIPAQDRGTGSVGIGGAARSNLIAGPDPDRESGYALASIKNNLGPKPATLSYELTEQFVELPDGPTGVPVIRWIGEVELDADDLVAPGKQGEAARFLERFLGEGPRASHEVRTAAEAEGLSWAGAVRRAADRLGVVKRPTAVGKKGAGWTWELPESSVSIPPLNSHNSHNSSPRIEHRIERIEQGPEYVQVAADLPDMEAAQLGGVTIEDDYPASAWAVA